MSDKSQVYKMKVLDSDGNPITLKPFLNLEQAVYWANRIRDLDEPASVVPSAKNERCLA